MGAISKAVESRGITIEPSKLAPVPITDANGTTVMLRAEDAALYVRGAGNVTQSELAAFFVRCAAWGVDPYKDEAYIIKFGNQPASIVIAEKVLEMRADHMPDYRGMEYGVIYEDADGIEHKREGKRVSQRAGERLVGAWARVHRDGRNPIYTEIALDEYAQTHRDKSGNVVYNTNWATKPGVMLTKCVKAAALRDAYPNAFEGMYVEEEMGARPEPVAVESHVEQVTTSVSESSAARADQQILMERIHELAQLRGVGDDVVYEGIRRSKALAAAGYDGGPSLTPQQINVACTQLERWIESARIESAVAVASDVTDTELESDAS